MDMFVISQWPWLRDRAIVRISIMSPIRFVRAVISPAECDVWFW